MSLRRSAGADPQARLPLVGDLSAARRAGHDVEPKRFTLGSTTDARASKRTDSEAPASNFR
jgi:hypothetical protein